MKCPEWLLDAMRKGESVNCLVWDDPEEGIHSEMVTGFDLSCKEFPFLTEMAAYEYAEPYKEPEHEFKPFDRVLVRDSDRNQWRCDIFSHTETNASTEYKFRSLRGIWKQCIPYEGNEALLGTTNSPE